MKSQQKVSKYQKFETDVISRVDIKNAEYNPRVISKEARARLKKMLSRHGLVTTPVWNRRTGNLVSGHQRLSILDELERSKEYAITVSVIDVDEGEEKKLNIQLNNPSMQGTWDMDLLLGLFEGQEDSFADFGFSEGDAGIMFGFDERELMPDAEEVTEAKNALDEIKKHRAEATEKLKDNNGINYYFTIVCESPGQKKALLKKLQCPEYEQFVNGAVLAAKLGV